MLRLFNCILFGYFLLTFKKSMQSTDLDVYIKTYPGDGRQNCKIDFYVKDFPEPIKYDNISTEDIIFSIIQKAVNNTAYHLNISSPKSLYSESKSVVTLAGVDDDGRPRLIVAACDRAFSDNNMSLQMENVILPRGKYNLTWVMEEKIFFHSFCIPLNRERRRDVCSWPLDCHTGSYGIDFNNKTGLLRFFYHPDLIQCTTIGGIKLLKYSDKDNVINKETCLNKSLENIQEYHDAYQVESAQKSQKIPVEFHHVTTGCYMIIVFSGCDYGSFWLHMNDSWVVDLDSWNTVILMIPRSEDSSLEVKWKSPGDPYNFTMWQVKLWSLRNHNISCTSGNVQNEKISTCCSAELNRTFHTFYNLSDGYYCARIFPMDKGCPEDGCEPRSSKSVRLIGKKMDPLPEPPKLNPILVGLLVVSGILSGIGMALLCYRFKPVSPRGERLMQVRTSDESMTVAPVLLLWTKYRREGFPNREHSVKQLKRQLKSLNCGEVLDYLDLPKVEKDKFYTDRHSWLTSHLDGTTKIVVLLTEGATYIRNNSCRELSNVDKFFKFIMHQCFELLEDGYTGRLSFVKFLKPEEEVDIPSYVVFSYPYNSEELIERLRQM